MVNKSTENDIKDIKKNIKEKRIVIGNSVVAEGLGKGRIEKVYISSNCSEEILGKLQYLAQLSGVDIIQLDRSNEDIGVLCKKPFSISVLGLLKS